MNHKPTTKKELRERRHARIRARVVGTDKRPRLAVFRSNRFISAQLIDDGTGKTLAAAHGRDYKGTQSEQAVAVGVAIAAAAKKVGITSAVFDRSGYRYMGQVKALADEARAKGLTF